MPAATIDVPTEEIGFFEVPGRAKVPDAVQRQVVAFAL